MSSRFSCIRFLAANVSKLAATRNTTQPAFNPLLQTRSMCSSERRLRRSPALTLGAPRAAVILCGSKAKNGTDPLEAACLIIHLARQGIKADFFAPSAPIIHSWKFSYGMNAIVMDESPRNRPIARVEAARLIPRHYVEELYDLEANHYDALIIPGGAGVLSILSDFLVRGEDGSVDEVVTRKIGDFRRTRKPIGTISYAGLLLTDLLDNIHFTLGRREPDNDLLTLMIHVARTRGATHHDNETDRVSEWHGVYTTPGFTNRQDPESSVFDGIGQLVNAIRSHIDMRRMAELN